MSELDKNILDKDLVARYLKDDPSAKNEIADSAQKIFLSMAVYASRFIDDKRVATEIAKDINQDFHVEARNVLQKWDPEKVPLTHFIRIWAERRVKDALRKEYRDHPRLISNFDQIPDFEEDIESRILDKADYEKLLNILKEELSEADQTLLVKLFIEELSTDQIAAEFGITLDAMYQRRHRLIRHIRETVARIQKGKSDL